jgi:hypothetical protein
MALNTLADVIKVVEKQQLEIQRLKDINEIQNLMGTYEFWHTAGLNKETVEQLWAKKTPGVRTEIANFGVYDGPEGTRKFWYEMQGATHGDRKGHMHLHTLTTPIIQVAGDGKTAKGVWISPGVETAPGPDKPLWAWVKYGIDFVKEDGKWKFWHFHLYRIFMTPYDKSWKEVPLAQHPHTFDSIPDSIKPDRPPTYSWSYSVDVPYENIPAPPEPYNVFDEKSAY